MIVVVVDADVAGAASNPVYAAAPNLQQCALNAILVNSEVSIAFDDQLGGEWNDNAGRYASQVRTELLVAGRVVFVALAMEADRVNLRNELIAAHSSESAIKLVQADSHLIEMAVATDRRVLSGDETARELFRLSKQTCGVLHSILWSNPAVIAEQVVDWINASLPYDCTRIL